VEPVEIIELGREYIVAGMEAMALYLSIVTGYLIVGYTAGKNLSKFQIFVITSLFLSFSCFFAIGTYTLFIRAHEIYLLSNSGAYEGNQRLNALWIGAAQALGVLASLAFMYDAQKK
jgi:hypothetical protein